MPATNTRRKTGRGDATTVDATEGFAFPDRWPAAADAEGADRLEHALRAEAERRGDLPRLARPDTATIAMIRALGGNAPFLAELARREMPTLEHLLRAGPAAAARAELARLGRLRPETPRATLGEALRDAKRRVALASAVADIGGMWTLHHITGTLSLLAEAALRAALAHLLLSAATEQRFVLADPRQPDRDSGFIVLAMGKLGARELNYSSDIDLVLLFDPDAQPTALRDGLQQTANRIAAELVSLMEARTAGGYVFRTDLRLRPDPGATPPVVSLPAALTYYESLGQNWERAAMIKARPVAGDIAAGERFLSAIRPFVWRRHLDFAAVADIHATKRRIDHHRGTGAPPPGAGPVAPGTSWEQAAARPSGGWQPAPFRARRGAMPKVEATAPAVDASAPLPDKARALLGFNLKLGRGGIREIEFLAQTLQLLWGGREPGLRDPTTLGALRRLADNNYLARSIAQLLSAHYRLLRRMEHRLQMQFDRQTHSLPADPAAFARFALFMDFDDAAALADRLTPVLRDVHEQFEHHLAPPPPVRDPDERAGTGQNETAGTLPDIPDPGDPELPGRLSWFNIPATGPVLDILRRWNDGGMRALRTERARGLLRDLMPTLLRAVGAQRDPAATLARFDLLLSRQPAGVQLLSLLARNPDLLNRLAVLLDASRPLADHLAAVPGALEGLLVPDVGPAASRTMRSILRRQMNAAADMEEAVRVARPLLRGEEFRLSAAQLEGAMSADAAGTWRTALADTAIEQMLFQVRREHERRFGRIPGGGMAVVALGKAGSRDMMSGSDLDLMLVYDHPAAVEHSVPISRRRMTGASPAPGAPGSRAAVPPRALPPSQFFARLAHALIAALSAPGSEGPLFALDMRLRPSGAKGPVAVSLESFRRYHAEQAWTWERLALCRARVVAGPPDLRRRIARAIDAAVIPPAGSRNPAVIRADVLDMRRRLLRDLPFRGAWDVKLRPGGLMELEFIAQALQLQAPPNFPRHPTTRVALRRLAQADLLANEDAALLVKADRFWRALQGMLRILLGPEPPATLQNMPVPALSLLMRALRCDDLAELEVRRDRTAADVRAVFNRVVGQV
ncbi:glutamine-synthetase adenylyltransferase [Rhizosaccharibacter radicis]|uniref:Glutamine-synthetase adenylyltransferase n=1 Tax=Rhizosaccharibacter radicis TaxID=2782605 RepID=A0ABT1VXN6_9PROT|nr:glutamine-synthetase adenylyltransferase [Acetobacteraceae bacterium KSS12]